jgi:hypothetical protein
MQEKVYLMYFLSQMRLITKRRIIHASIDIPAQRSLLIDVAADLRGTTVKV